MSKTKSIRRKFSLAFVFFYILTMTISNLTVISNAIGTLPSVPTNVVATSAVDSITVTWGTVADATGYDIEVDGTVIDNGNSTTYLHSGLAPNTSHTYRVRAKNSVGTSAWSNAITQTTLPNPPGVPVNVVTTASAITITVTWDTMADATGYDVEVDGTTIDNGNSTTYTHTGLTPNTSHTYRVRSKNAGGTSDWSALITQSTLASAPNAPATPTNVVTTASAITITVTWDAVTDATGYDIEVDGIVVDNGNSTTYVHSGLSPNTTHTYRVRAKNSGGTSAWSNVITQTTLPNPPGIPTNVIATSTTNTVTVTWDTLTDATGYDIEVDGVVIDNGNSTTYVHSGLLPSTTHTYRVRSKNSGGTSGWSALITQSTLPNPPGIPANLAATAGTTVITVTWSAVAYATGYDIEVDGTVIDNGNSTTYVHSGLTPNTTHTYRVRAKNTGGTSDWSSAISKTTLLSTSVSGTITQDTTWTVGNSPYILTGTITVNSGVTLTIEPGVVVKSGYAGITVNGKISALGTSQSPIVFTDIKDASYGGSGVTSSNDYWCGIDISSTGELVGDYIKVRYGGYFSYTFYNSINVSGKLTLTNSEVSNSYYWGITASTNNSITIQNCSIANNRYGGISATNSGLMELLIKDNTFIGNPSCISVTNSSTGTITIDSNTMNNGYYGVIIANNSTGIVTVQNNSISIQGNSGGYYGIQTANGGAGTTTIQNNTITSASPYAYAIKVQKYGLGTLSIENNNINFSGYPLYVSLDGFTAPISSLLNEVSNNTFTGTNNTVILVSGLNISMTLPNTQYFSSYEGRGITINSGVTLTIDPGVIIKTYGNWSGITVNGKLCALGTAQNPIVFTTINDPVYGGSGVPSYTYCWQGITVSSTGELVGDNIKVRYGASNGSANITIQGKATITNSEISNSNYNGIYFDSTSQPILLFNSIVNNSAASIYNNRSSTMTIDASYNYWGSANGPSTTGVNRVSAGVNYAPWLGGSYNIQIHFGENGTNAASGNFSRTYTDMSVPAPGFQLNFGRTYNSRDNRTNGPLGRGWTFSFEGSVKDASTGSNIKVVSLPNGSKQSFIQNSDGTYTALDSRNTLVKQTDGSFVLTTKGQHSYGFSASGWLVWMKNRNGNTITISVDANGKVTGVTDGANRNYTITYNLQGQITSITDPMGRVVTYEYENNLLVRAIDPMGSITRYSYDTQNFLSEVKDNNSNLIESIVYNHAAGADQDKVSQTTDAFGNIHTYTYDDANNKTTITDSNGRQTISWYDGQLYSTNSQDAEGKLTVVENQLEPNGIDKYGEKKSITDRNGNKTQYQRDQNGNITEIINPDGSTKDFTYDSKNNVTSEKDELGKLTYYIYDANGINLVKKVQPLSGTDQYTGVDDPTKFAVTNYVYYTDAECQSLGYLAKGLLKSITDPDGNTTTYTYDANGDIQTVTDPMGKVTTYTYNQIGWKTSSETPNHYRTDYDYDKNGNIERTTVNNGDVNIIPITKSSVTRVTYDAEGRKTKEVSPNQYDPLLDNIAAHTYSGDVGYRFTYYPNGKINTVTDPENNITSYTYDLYGNAQTETKPNGSIYTYEYDVMNRPTKVWFKDNSAATPVLLKSYTYTILADKTTQKTQTEYLNVTDTAVTTYTYDYADRLIKQQNPDGTIVSTNYNANGTVNTTTDANNSTTYYKYDGLNRPTEKWTPFETVNGSTMYTYTSTSYDNAGNKTSEKIDKDETALWAPTLNLISTNYTYNTDGRVSMITDSAGRKKTYTYDDDGNVSEEDDYTDSVNKNVTQYIYNYLEKPVEKDVHVKQGDIFGNSFSDNTDKVLSTTYTYDKDGNVITETTPDGVTTTYTYDNLNRQLSKSQPGVDENGAPVTISNSTTFNWEGKPLTQTDANGNITNYSYNQRGLLEKVTDVKGGVTAYYYDTAGRKTAEVSPLNYDSTKTLAQMSRTEYTYDLMDRVKTKTNTYLDPVTAQWVTVTAKAYKYDNNGNVVKELDALGYEAGTGTTTDQIINSGYGTEYTYNLANQAVTVLDPVSKDRGLAFTTKYSYDAAGRKTAETNANNVVTSYVYDDAGNITSTAVNNQTTQTITYDLLGNVLTKTDTNSNTTVYAYNAFNKVRSVVYPGDSSIPSDTVNYQYDVMGNLKSQQDSVGTVDLYTYDNQNRELSHTQQKADGTEAITTSIKYDKNGSKRFVTDGNGVTTTNTYDELNRFISSMLTVSGTAQTTAYAYDADGNQISQTDWRGNTYTNKYDPLNRLIEKDNPDNKTIQKLEYNHNGMQIKSYDALNNLTQYSYDKNNRLITTIDPEGHTTSQTYDNIGNIQTKTDGNGKITTYGYDQFNRLISILNAKNETTSYTYDLNGNMLTQKDGKGNTETYTYNVMNKPVTKIDQGGAGVPAKTESYTYYANGKLAAKTDRNGNTTTYVYDSHGRKLSETVGTTSISYTYDNNGNQLTTIDGTGTTTRTYDQLNRVTTKTVPNIGTSTYVYDIISNVPAGFTEETSTDPKGNITTKVYDKEGRLAQVTADGQTTTYSYYDNGAKQSVVYPNSSSESYTYYKNNLLNTLVNKKADGTVIDSYSYTYDGANNQTSKVDSKGTTNYTYDELERLKSVTEPSGKVTTYTFDAAGNRLSETITDGTNTTVTNYTYNEQNRLTNTTTQQNGITIQTVDYTYDNNGNVLTETKTSYVGGVPQTEQVTTNTYDLLNQLIQTITPDNKTVSNTYNGEGLRVAKTVDGATTNYLYEYDKVVLETDGSGAQKARNVYGTNLISRTVSGQTAFYMYNGHADVTTLIDGTGNTLASYYYDAFGNITEQTGTFDNNITYAGYQYDKETGKYYLNARMYDPVSARFMQEDTYSGDVNDPLSLNLYTYVHNEPIMYTDPNGHWEWWDKKKAQAEQWWDETKYKAYKKSDELVYDFNKATDVMAEKAGKVKDYVVDKAVEAKNYVVDKATKAKDYVVDKAKELGKAYLKEVIISNATGLNYFQRKNIENEINQSKSMLKARGIDESNPNYEQLLIDQTSTMNEANEIVTGMFGGIKIKGFKTLPGVYDAESNFIKGTVTKEVEGQVIKNEVANDVVNGTASTIANTNTTKLYRVMSENEYNSLVKSGQFTQYDKAMESKWFATNTKDAAEWGKKFYPDGNYKMVEIEVPKDSLSQMYHADKLDGIGPAYCSERDFINSVIKSIKEVTR